MNKALFLIVSGVFTALGGFAQTAAAPADSATSVKSTFGKDAGGMVFVDPVTRKIRKPSAAEIGAIPPASQSQSTTTGGEGNAANTAATAAPQVIHGPGAAVGVLLDDSKMKYTVATRNSDGTISMECVTGPEQAEARVTGSTHGAALSKETAGKETK